MPHLALTPSRLLALCLALFIAGCATGPAYVKPAAEAPQDWTQWRSGDALLHAPVSSDHAAPQVWWTALGDPVLDDLERRAIAASPDLRTAALHFAQSRVQRGVTSSQAGPQVKLDAGAVRQRQSEWGAGTRLLDAIGGNNREALASLLSEPFTLYQAGFDASWELDLWGRVGHAIEGADADVAAQAALLDLARLSLSSDVAQRYLEYRTAQRQLRVLREDIAAQQDRQDLLRARVDAGVVDHFDLERQNADLANNEAQVPALLAQGANSMGQLELLLGEHPGALNDVLAPETVNHAALPDLTLGLPSEVAERRPDIRAAEAKLRRAAANIGVARADLYPSIRLGAKFGLESYKAGEFTDWASRSWSIGPTLELPIFDHGRRVRVVQLRELEQQEAAINYQRTVLQAWHEIDSALNGYAAERLQLEKQQGRASSSRQVFELASARYRAGTVDFSAVIDGQRALLQARREEIASEGRLKLRYVALNKAIAARSSDVGTD